MKPVIVFIGVVLLAVGVSSLFVPDLLAAAFGIPADAPTSRAYLRATGARDIAMGCWLLAILWFGAPTRILSASMFAIAIVAAGDAVNVFTQSGGRGSIALLGHLASLGVLLAVGVSLWRVKRN